MEHHTKEALYGKYCVKCKHHKLEGWRDPCNDCLNQGWNIDSHKPVFFEEARIKDDGGTTSKTKRASKG